MKSLYRPILLFLCSICALSAQDFTVSGSVENAGNEPVPFANVQLLSGADSTLVNGASTDESGHFEIDGVARGGYLIKASYIENESQAIPFELISDLDLDPIQLGEDAQALDEVVVTSRKPRLERKIDRLVFSIENTALADSDIWGVLRRTPGISIVNDQVSVKGSKAVGILINGREVNLPKGDIINLLSGVSASDVGAIEVITSPPAKYGAENVALINILKKKNVIAGYNGAVYNKYTQGILPKHTIGTDHYFKGEKAQFSLNYSFAHDRNVVKFTDITNFLENNTATSTWTAEQELLRRSKRHNLSAFFDYDLNDKSRLSLSAITVWQPEIDRFYDTETAIVGDTLSGFNTINDSDERHVNTSYYLDYERDLNEEGAELSLNSHFTYYDYNRGQDLDTDFFNTDGNFSGEDNFVTDSDQIIRLFTAQADYTTPTGENGNFGTGLRYAGINSDSKVSQEGFDRDRPGIDPTETGNFEYDESIYAAYVSYDANWEKWSLQTGLRAEYTETDGVSNTQGKVTDNDYLKLFPSFSVSYDPLDNHIFTFYGDRRIARPRYQQINPFLIFQSNFSTLEGNPGLLPEIKDYLAAGYTFKGSYTVELFYSHDSDPLSLLTFQDNDAKLLRFVNSNMESRESFGLDLKLNKQFTGFWYSYVAFSFFDQTNIFRNLGNNTLVEKNQFAWYVQSTNSFTFLEDGSLTADVYFNYLGPKFTGNTRFDGYGALSLSLRKTFWNNKASITMGVEDIFNQGNMFSTRDFLDQSGSSLERNENRLFVLGLRYKFGNLKIRDNYKRKNTDEGDRL
ncbi:MAG: outer membrane beta-barrel family protein [Pricia sp.]